MANFTTFKEVKAHLRKLGRREIDPVDERWGICAELENFEVLIENDAVWKRCPYFSGSAVYPIASPDPDFSQADIYADDNTPMWSEGEYAARRRRVCLWLANNLKKSDLHFWGSDYD